MAEKQDKSLIVEVLEEFNMSVQAFADFSGIPRKTIDGWRTKGVSQLGVVALNNILKVKELQEKCDDFDTILRIQNKYMQQKLNTRETVSKQGSE